MNPKDANTILSLILNRHEIYHGSVKVWSKQMLEYGFSKEYMEDIFRYIVKEKPNYITLTEDGGDLFAKIVAGNEKEVRQFLAAGGFNQFKFIVKRYRSHSLLNTANLISLGSLIVAFFSWYDAHYAKVDADNAQKEINQLKVILEEKINKDFHGNYNLLKSDTFSRQDTSKGEN